MYRNNLKNLEDLKDAVKSVVRRLPLSVCCAAAEATLRRASSETGVISNVSSARLSKATGDGRTPHKQNMFDQAFK